MKKVFVLFKRDDAVVNTAVGDNSSSSLSSRNSTTIATQTSSSSFFSGSLSSSTTATSSLLSSSSSSSSILSLSSTTFPSSSSSFSRINGLNTISSTPVVSSSSQDPYYPSVSQSSKQGLPESLSGSISSSSSSVAKTSLSSSSFKTVSSSDLPPLSGLKSHSHSHPQSISTPQLTISSSSTPSTSSSIPPFSTSSSSLITKESSSIPLTTTIFQELTSSTYSYSQEYIITDSATTFTESIPTQTIVTFAINTLDSSSQVSSSFTYQPTPITTDLSYYQTVLSHHSSSDNNSEASTQSKDNSNNKGKIAGGVVGGIFGLILMFLLIWFLYKRRKFGQPHDEENPFASSGDTKPKFGFFKKITRKNTSLEELNEKRIPYYGASIVTNNGINNFNPITNNQPNNHNNRSFESLSSVSLSSILQRRGSSSNSITSLQRPSLPSRKSSEESLGLGGLSQNILSHQQHDSTKNIKIETDVSNTKHPTSYFAPSDQSDIMNSNANSPTYPSRQMDVLYEEEISDVASNLESSTAELTKSKMAHYKQSSRYNHIGLTPVPPTELATRISKIPPPIPKPRKLLHGSLSSQNNKADIYDSLNIQGQREQATGLLDDESFDSSLLDLSSFDDISSSTGSNI